MQQTEDAELISILRDFDGRSTLFEALELSGRLNGLTSRRLDGGIPVSPELRAETIAWQLIPDYGNDRGWGTYYGPVMEWADGVTVPSLEEITPEVLRYWTDRASAATHPLLRARYADVAWDFALRANLVRLVGNSSNTMIDATLAAACSELFPNEIEGYRQLERALRVALRNRDSDRVGRVAREILSYEKRHAVDHLPGTWGRAYDLLFDGDIHLSAEQEAEIVCDMEARLERLSSLDAAQFDPYHIEGAALRLARYYRCQGQKPKIQRVMKLYADAYVKKAETNPSVGSAWLESVYRRLVEFHLHDEAKAFQDAYRQAARRMVKQLPRHEFSIPIDQSEWEKLLRHVSEGSWDEVFGKFIGLFLPVRKQHEEMLNTARKDRFLLDLFLPTLVDHEGRTVARPGTYDQDPEGHLVDHYRNIVFQSTGHMMRNIVETWCRDRGLMATDFAEYLYRSPILDPKKRPIIESAIKAYLEHDWIVTIHLLVPQIEGAIRTLVDKSARHTMRAGKHGGLHLRTLDDLLGDEAVSGCLGSDAVFYLRAFLTDQRGANVRNDVAHGITPMSGFNSQVADRLMHILLLLGSVRANGTETEVKTVNNETVPAEGVAHCRPNEG